MPFVTEKQILWFSVCNEKSAVGISLVLHADIKCAFFYCKVQKKDRPTAKVHGMSNYQHAVFVRSDFSEFESYFP